MADNYIHFLNNTGVKLIAAAYHDLIKRRYYHTTLDANGGRGTPYAPSFQSYEYTIRMYDENDESKLCEYQYVCVENQSFFVEVTNDNGFRLRVAPYPVPEGGRRPVYVISHRCNDIDDIGNSIAKGANAIECDVRRDGDGIWHVNHDFASGTKLKDWIVQAKVIALAYPQEFALIIFDIKTPEHLSSMKQCVNENGLPASVWVVYSIADYDKRGAFDEIASNLNDHEGLAIDFDDDPVKVQAYFNEKSVTRFWYGDGINAATPDSKKLRDALKKAGVERDANRGIKKSYIWTLEKRETMAEYLYIEKVDGIMTNVMHPVGESGINNILALINSSIILRKAKRSDNAFSVFRWTAENTAS